MKKILPILLLLGIFNVSAAEKRFVNPGMSDTRSAEPCDALAIKPGTGYESQLKLFIHSSEPGALLYMAVVQYDAEGKEVDRVYSTEGQSIISSGIGRNIRRKFTSHAKAVSAKPVIYYGGNAIEFSVESWKLEDVKVFNGIYAADDPMPADRMKALEAMKAIPPAQAEVVSVNGKPVLMVDGKQMIVNAYKGHTDYKLIGEAGGDLVVTFNCGQRLFTNERWDKALWDYETGKFDFSRIEDNLLRIHNANPKARVILCIDVTPDKFMEKFPDSIALNAKGLRGKQGFTAFEGWSNTPLKGRQRWAFSYASKEIWDFVNGALTELATYLKNSPAGNIVIGFHLAGGMDGQFVQWDYGPVNGHFDYSEGTRKALCGYLREIYGSDEALQKAWGDPNVTLDTAANPKIEEFRSMHYFNDKPGLGRKIADCRRFVAVGTARFLNSMGKTLKKAWGRPAVVLSWYSTAIWAQPSRLALDELLKDGAVNMTGMVTNYGRNRTLDGAGGSANSCVQALNLRNCIYIQEMDHRTWRSHINQMESRNMAAIPEKPADFHNQVLRDAASVIAIGGQGYYFYDMYGSWYHAPEAKETLRTAFALNHHASRYVGQYAAPRAAIFMDENNRLMSEHVLMGVDSVWRTSGVTPALHFISDLTNEKLPEYDLYVLWSPLTINKVQLEALKKLADRPGKVLYVAGDVGKCSRDFSGPVEVIGRLGMKLLQVNSSNGYMIVPEKESVDPVLENITHKLGHYGSYLHKGKFRRYYYFDYTIPNDADAKVLGFFENGMIPAFAVKQMPGGGKLYYSSRNATLDSKLFHNLAKVAGINPYSKPGNAVFVGNGVAAIHRISAEEAVIDFGRETTLLEPVSGRIIGKMRYWKPQVAPGECAVVCYLPDNVNK